MTTDRTAFDADTPDELLRLIHVCNQTAQLVTIMFLDLDNQPHTLIIRTNAATLRQVLARKAELAELTQGEESDNGMSH